MASHPDLAPGDLVVATEVRLADGATCTFPAARLLAGELQRAGLRAIAGPIRSVERVARGGAREQLAADGAVAVDMESGWLLEDYPLDGVAAVVRAVVDTARRELVSPWTPYGAWRAAQALRAAVPVLERWADTTAARRVVLASPRGFCAGVERAIDIVERALDRYGPPVYVRRQIIHNVHVVADLAERGAIFVDELDEVPGGSRVVFAAHGVAPSVRDEAGDRDLLPIDATCPLVAKVHSEVRRFAGRGFQVLLIGHADHEEVEGTVGEAPAAITVVEHADEVDAIEVADPERVAYVTQTTLAVDDVAEVVARLRERFPKLEGPPATTSATPPRTARTPPGRWPSSAISCSWWARATRRIPTGSSRSCTGRAARPTSSTTTARSSWPGSPVPAPSASPPARRPRRRWCSASSPPWGPSGPSRSRSAPS